MIHADLASGMEVTMGAVNLRPAGHVVDLAEVPGHEAARAYSGGWRKAYFNAGFDEEAQSMYSRLALSAPLEELKPGLADGLVADAVLKGEGVDPAALDRVASAAEEVQPALLAWITERSGEIDLVLCAAGTAEQDYMESNPAALLGNHRFDGQPELHAYHAFAIHSLHEALTNTGAYLLGEGIKEHYGAQA